MQSGTICLRKASRNFFLDHLRGIVSLRKWRVILVFYCLVFYCVILVCCVFLYFVFIITFVTEVFKRLSLGMSFCYRFSPINTLRVFRIEPTWILPKDVVSALFRHGIHLKCLQRPCWRLLLHSCLFKTLTLLFFNKLIYYFY